MSVREIDNRINELKCSLYIASKRSEALLIKMIILNKQIKEAYVY